MSRLILNERGIPETPPADKMEVFAQSGTPGTLKVIKDDGSVVDLEAGGAGGGDNVSVNGSPVTDVNFGSLPAAPGGAVNVVWQLDAGPSPDNASAHVVQSSLDHGSIGGLADDDHAQYARLAGRAAGQTIQGGTAASENLSLESTANATKGLVRILDPLDLLGAYLRILTAINEGRINIPSNGVVPAIRFIPGSGATEVLWSTDPNGGALWRGRYDSVSGRKDLYLERHDGSAMLTVFKADRHADRLGIFGDYDPSDAGIGLKINQGLTQMVRGLDVNLGNGTHAIYDRFTVGPFVAANGTFLLSTDAANDSVTVRGTKSEAGRVDVRGYDDSNRATFLAEAHGTANPHLFLFVGKDSLPSGANSYGWRFEEETASNGNFRIVALVNGTQTRVFHFERATGYLRLPFRLKIGADSAPAYDLDVTGNGSFTTYVDFPGISAPANPSSGTRRLFTNSATGELSVRTSGGTTVSLEAGGAGEANTASNQGVGGVGFFDAKVGVDLQFRNLNVVSSSRLSVALDAGNKEVDIDIPADAIDDTRLRNSAGNSVLGRSASSSGDPADLVAGTDGHVLRLAGTTLGFGTVATAGIGDDQVTYAKLQNVSATSRFLGRITAGAGDPEELTGTQATTLLDNFTSALKGTAPASGGGTTNFLRADGTWAAPPGGGGGDSITVNGSGVVDADFDDATPAAPSGGVNVKWQKDASSPANVSAHLAANDVSNTVLRDSSANSVIGRASNTSGDPADIAAGTDGHVLRLSGTTLGFGTVATAGIGDDQVTYAKIQNVATDRLLGRDTAGSGDAEELTVSGGLEFTGTGGIQRSALTGDVTASAGSNSTTIANDAVTYAKMQNVSATDRLLGRDTAGAGDVEELTVGGGVEFTGTGIQRSALTGDVTASAGSNSTTIANDAVTYAKMQNVSAASKLLGRGSAAGAGDPEEITLGSGLSMSGTTLSSTGGGGDSVSVNGTAATDADLDNATPAAPAGGTNVKWQSTGASPTDISAYVDWGTVMTGIRRRPFYYADFINAGSTGGLNSIWSGSAITGGTNAGQAGTSHHPGITRFSSAAGANTGYQYGQITGNNMIFGGGETFELVFNIATLTNTTIRFGFGELGSTDFTDGAYIEIPSTGAAVGKTANNAVRTTSATIATLSTATWYRGRIAVNSGATAVDFTIWTDDGTQQGTQQNTSNIPTAAGREFSNGVVGLSQSSVAIVDIDWIALWWETRALTR